LETAEQRAMPWSGWPGACCRLAVGPCRGPFVRLNRRGAESKLKPGAPLGQRAPEVAAGRMMVFLHTPGRPLAIPWGGTAVIRPRTTSKDRPW